MDDASRRGAPRPAGRRTTSFQLRGTCAIVRRWPLVGEGGLYATAVATDHMTGSEFLSETGWNTLTSVATAGLGSAGSVLDDSGPSPWNQRPAPRCRLAASELRSGEHVLS